LRFLYAHSTFYGINDNQVAVLASYMLLGGVGGAAPAPNAVPALSPYGLKPISPLSTMPPPH
jgi:hypothetical protein